MKRMRLKLVALTLVIVHVVVSASACGSNRTSTAPSSTDAGVAPNPSDGFRILRIDSDTSEVESLNPPQDGFTRLRIEGMQSEHPIYYLDGVLVGELFGTASADLTSFRMTTSQLESGRQVAATGTVIPAIVAALTAWAAVQLVHTCGTELLILENRLTAEAWNACAYKFIDQVAGRIGLKLLPTITVTRISELIKAAVDRAISWSQLRALFNKYQFKLAKELVEQISATFAGAIYSVIVALYLEQVELYSVKGKVTDRATGEPISGISIRLTSNGNETAVSTGADGNYDIGPFPLQPGAYSVLAIDSRSPARYTAEARLVGLPSFSQTIENFALQPVTSHRTFEGPLDITLSGTCVARDGSKVSAQSQHFTGTMRVVMNQSAGQFTTPAGVVLIGNSVFTECNGTVRPDSGTLSLPASGTAANISVNWVNDPDPGPITVTFTVTFKGSLSGTALSPFISGLLTMSEHEDSPAAVSDRTGTAAVTLR